MKRKPLKVDFCEVRYPGVLLQDDDEATLIDGLCRRCYGWMNKEMDENESAFASVKGPVETDAVDTAAVEDYFVEGCQLCEFDQSFREADEQLEKVGIYS